MAEVRLENVVKNYEQVEVIRNISLQISHGEFCVFVGPSGCGKSTLLRLISGLGEVTSGEILIDGEIVNAIPPADRGLAMVFQSYALYPHMSVRQNLSFGLENLGAPRKKIREKVDEVAKMLQIDMLLDRRPKDLSGGQRQRVAIGRAVVREPKVFLFDEPLSNLDAELRVDMRAEIAGLHKRLGNTMIYVTHDQVEAMTMADKIAVLRQGVLEQFGPPLELYNAPANLFVAGFIGSPKMNFLDAAVSRADRSGGLIEGDGLRIEIDRPDFAISEGKRVKVGVRPNHFRHDDAGELGLEIGAVEQLGGESFFHGAGPGGASMIVRMEGQTALGPGDRIGLEIDHAHLHLFDAESGGSLRTDA